MDDLLRRMNNLLAQQERRREAEAWAVLERAGYKSIGWWLMARTDAQVAELERIYRLENMT